MGSLLIITCVILSAQWNILIRPHIYIAGKGKRNVGQGHGRYFVFGNDEDHTLSVVLNYRDDGLSPVITKCLQDVLSHNLDCQHIHDLVATSKLTQLT